MKKEFKEILDTAFVFALMFGYMPKIFWKATYNIIRGILKWTK